MKNKPDYVIKATAKCFENIVKVCKYEALDMCCGRYKRVCFEIESELFMLCSLSSFNEEVDTNSQALVYDMSYE